MNQFNMSGSVTAQIFVVGGATSVIAFIIRDVGDASNSTWIIQVSSKALISIMILPS
jgi:hypothetical protein